MLLLLLLQLHHILGDLFLLLQQPTSTHSKSVSIYCANFQDRAQVTSFRFETSISIMACLDCMIWFLWSIGTKMFNQIADMRMKVNDEMYFMTPLISVAVFGGKVQRMKLFQSWICTWKMSCKLLYTCYTIRPSCTWQAMQRGSNASLGTAVK